MRHYTRPLRDAEVDTVILGCTHYPLIGPLLQRMLGRGVEIVSSGTAIARQVEHVLGSRGLGNTSSTEGDYRFLTSGDPEALRASGTRFLQLPIGSVEHVAVQTELVGRDDERPDPQRRARRGRAAAGDDRARVRAHRDRLGADLVRRDAGDLHGVGPGVGPALDGRPRQGLDDRRVRDASRVDGRAQAA